MNIEIFIKIIPIIVSTIGLIFTIYVFKTRIRYKKNDLEIRIFGDFEESLKYYHPLSFIILGITEFSKENILIHIPISISNKSKSNTFNNFQLRVCYPNKFRLNEDKDEILNELSSQQYRKQKIFTRSSCNTITNRAEVIYEIEKITPGTGLVIYEPILIPKNILNTGLDYDLKTFTNGEKPITFDLTVCLAPQDLEATTFKMKVIIMKSESTKDLYEKVKFPLTKLLEKKTFNPFKQQAYKLYLNNPILYFVYKKRFYQSSFQICHLPLLNIKLNSGNEFSIEKYEKEDISFGDMRSLIPKI